MALGHRDRPNIAAPPADQLRGGKLEVHRSVSATPRRSARPQARANIARQSVPLMSLAPTSPARIR